MTRTIIIGNKKSLSKISDKNPQWKGNDVGYSALHDYIRRHLSKPELCEICNIRQPCDLANITGIYNRDFGNWKYLCKKCHNRYDGPHNTRDMSGRRCESCGSTETYIRNDGYVNWYLVNNGFICMRCYARLRWHKLKTKKSFLFL